MAVEADVASAQLDLRPHSTTPGRAGTIRIESPNTLALSPTWMRENPQLGAEPGD